MNLRHRAVGLLEHWYEQVQTSGVRPPHALVAVQELRLEQSAGSAAVRAKSSTVSAGSRPPIRDLDRIGREVDRMMRHLENVNPGWRYALELYASHGSIRKAAKAIARTDDDAPKLAASLWREFNQGLAVLQSEIVRTGI